jgi:hypothetical protein
VLPAVVYELFPGEPEKWDHPKVIAATLQILNSRVSAARGMSPFYGMFGVHVKGARVREDVCVYLYLRTVSTHWVIKWV